MKKYEFLRLVSSAVHLGLMVKATREYEAGRPAAANECIEASMLWQMLKPKVERESLKAGDFDRLYAETVAEYEKTPAVGSWT